MRKNGSSIGGMKIVPRGIEPAASTRVCEIFATPFARRMNDGP